MVEVAFGGSFWLVVFANIVTHLGESGWTGALVNHRKPTSLAVFLNWIVNNWCLYQGSIPWIYIS